MNIWINKCSTELPDKDYKDAYIFSIDHERKATIFSNIKDIWRKALDSPISSIQEDLTIIALSVFGIDKRVNRFSSSDNWTRTFKVSIPVLNYKDWVKTKLIWDEMLSYLTGDNWDINFRKTQKRYGNYSEKRRNKIQLNGYDAVSLFSGGLDSFCGALELLHKGQSVCFVGHNEYPKLAKRQKRFKDRMYQEYPNQKVDFISFTANSRAPVMRGEKLAKSENTSRGRSLLFLCVGISIASIIGENIPLYIPENGFIGLNIPLTNSRKGTCSTRTTHPYFLRKFNEVLNIVGISNQVDNFFAYKTKREIVKLVKDNQVFLEEAGNTISCSHPCQPRWNKNGDKTYPKNCGYCYPCLIRKSALLDVEIEDLYTQNNSLSARYLKGDKPKNVNISDAVALMNSVYRFNNFQEDKEIIRLIKCTGPLTSEEIGLFLNVYKSTMNDIKQLICDQDEVIKYVGD